MRALIPAALLLSVASLAQAEVATYGLIDLSYGKNAIDFLTGRHADYHSGGDDGSSQGNSTTRVGLKGSQDVGSGVKVNFKLETNGITGDGDVPAPLFNRQAWAGLSGKLGEVRLGRQDSVAFQTMIDFDFNGAANAASAFGNAGMAAWWPGRQSRSLQYIAPTIVEGWKVQVGFKPKGNEFVTLDGIDYVAKATGSFGVTYSAGPLSAAITGDSGRYSYGRTFVAIAGSYDFGVAKVMLSYADGGEPYVKNTVVNGVNSPEGKVDGSGKGTGFGIVAPIAGYNVGLNYGSNSTTKVKATEVFVNREVLKGLTAYLDLGTVTPDQGKKANAYAVGMIYAF